MAEGASVLTAVTLERGQEACRKGDWAIGLRTGRVSYPMIRRIRLGYKPTNLANSRFIAEIWPLNSAKIPLQSVSARSLIDMENLGGDYTKFLRELHRRVAAANANCVYEAGLPAWRWWPSLALGVLTLGALLYILVQGVVAGQYLIAGLMTLIGGWFIWQIWNILRRNRPRTYRPDAIPEDVLPKS